MAMHIMKEKHSVEIVGNTQVVQIIFLDCNIYTSIVNIHYIYSKNMHSTTNLIMHLIILWFIFICKYRTIYYDE